MGNIFFMTIARRLQCVLSPAFPSLQTEVIKEISPKTPSDEQLNKKFLDQIYKRLVRLTANEKQSYRTDFGRLLNQTNVLAPLGEPIDHPHKGRTRKPKQSKKKEDSAKSTKREKSHGEHIAEANTKKKKVGHPRKAVEDQPQGKNPVGRPRKIAKIDPEEVKNLQQRL
ncbi:hypothetical protein H4Q26_006690 [Puccinia striiformis f. sp. tritici PST-130]|nr:hypothetical protein H4Q26_006690 [Puccinia striiformis f. sp. tritici PST-130]